MEKIGQFFLYSCWNAVTEDCLGSSCGDSQILLSQFDPEQNRWSVNLTNKTPPRHVNLNLQHYFYQQKSVGGGFSFPVRQLFIHLKIKFCLSLSLRGLRDEWTVLLPDRSLPLAVGMSSDLGCLCSPVSGVLPAADDESVQSGRSQPELARCLHLAREIFVLPDLPSVYLWVPLPTLFQAGVAWINNFYESDIFTINTADSFLRRM